MVTAGLRYSIRHPVKAVFSGSIAVRFRRCRSLRGRSVFGYRNRSSQDFAPTAVFRSVRRGIRKAASRDGVFGYQMFRGNPIAPVIIQGTVPAVLAIIRHKAVQRVMKPPVLISLCLRNAVRRFRTAAADSAVGIDSVAVKGHYRNPAVYNKNTVIGVRKVQKGSQPSGKIGIVKKTQEDHFVRLGTGGN